MIFVFEVHIKAGHTAEQYAAAWAEASEIIQRAPGARGTRLHRSATGDGVLLAIASWDSKARRDDAETIHDPAVRRIIETQAEHVEIRVVGEFEDPQWVVVPPRDDA